MSVHAATAGAPVEVRWRDPLTRRNRSRRFDDQDRASQVDRAIQAALALDRAQAAWEAIPASDRRAAREALDAA